MSTKIWVAWRVPKEKLNDFLRFAWATVYAGFFEHFDMLVSLVKDEEVVSSLSKYDGELKKETRILRAKVRWVMDRCHLAWAKPDDTLYHVQAGFNIWLDDEYAYATPWGDADRFMRASGVQMPEWCGDYHYQDQSDSILTPEEDAEREAKWTELCLDDHEITRLCYFIIDFQPYAWRTRAEISERIRRLE